MHKHHIIPRHMGGTDDPENLIEVTVEEHAELHRRLWMAFGKEEDRIAWHGLSGQISIHEAHCQALSESAKGNQWRKGKTFTQESRDKISSSLMGNTNKRGKKCNWTEEGMASLREHNRKKFLENNPMSNPVHVEKVRQKALRKKPCPNCGWLMNDGNLSRHVKKCYK